MSPNQAGVIRLKSSMDYETSPQEYTLEIRLSDIGDPPKTNPDEMTIKVNLININDNMPIFDTLTDRQVNITESTALGTSILDTKASDADQNALVYSLQGQESAPFSINPLTGTIRTNTTSFNYNTQRKFCFLAKVSDGKFTAYSNIIIRVIDINNNVPVITNQDTEITVSENLKVGTILRVITYEDKDQGVAGQVDVSITLDTPNADTFRIQNTNQLVLAKELDFEEQQLYTIKIRATDRGIPARQSAEKTFAISVLNINDNAPFIVSIPSSVNINEGVYNDGEVAEFEIGDRDGSLNTLTVDLLDAFSIFRIQNSGDVGDNKYKLLVTGALNYEQRRQYHVTVVLSDGKFKNVTAIQVNVVDVNEPPTVSTTSYNITVSEIVPVDSMILRIQASDPDTADSGNAKLTYNFAAGINPPNPFIIDKDTGIVYLKSSLDFEITKRYDLEITVSDGALTASPNTKLQINVAPVNEHAPRIYTSSRIVTIDENESLNYQIFANDTDARHSGSIVRCCSFSIVFQTTPGLFEIIENAGQPGLATLRNTQTLDHEAITSQMVTLEIQDGDTPPKVSLTDLQINIRDVNDNVPVFSNDVPSTLTIPETYPVDTVVAIITTLDADSGVNGKIDLAIIAGNSDNDFTINSGNAIIVQKPISYLRTNVYDLKLRATDQGSPSRSSETDLRITIKQENIHPPVFATPVVTISINEGVYTNHKLYEARASDSDGNALVYTLVNEATSVTIVPSNGSVILDGTFDVRVQQEHAVVIQASDGQLSATMVLLVKILDVNQAPQISDQQQSSITLLETTPIGSLLFMISAVDNDVDVRNRELVYEIVSGNDGNKFRIDITGGAIYLEDKLNFEDQRNFQLAIRVSKC